MPSPRLSRHFHSPGVTPTETAFNTRASILCRHRGRCQCQVSLELISLHTQPLPSAYRKRVVRVAPQGECYHDPASRAVRNSVTPRKKDADRSRRPLSTTPIATNRDGG